MQMNMFELGLTREILDEVKTERERQVKLEGWTLEHDDQHRHGEIASAALGYTMAAVNPAHPYIREFWPWDWKWFKPKNPRRDLIRAAALIVAEIERIDRIERAAKDDPFPPEYSHCGSS